jgi:hypothetical protein
MEKPQPDILTCSQFSILVMLWRLEINFGEEIICVAKLPETHRPTRGYIAIFVDKYILEEYVVFQVL